MSGDVSQLSSSPNAFVPPAMAQAFKFLTSVSEGVTDGGSTSYGVSVVRSAAQRNDVARRFCARLLTRRARAARQETDLPEYADHGEAANPEAPQPPEGDSEGDSDTDVVVKLSALTLIPERRISVRRTYTAFVAVRWAALACTPSHAC